MTDRHEASGVVRRGLALALVGMLAVGAAAPAAAQSSTTPPPLSPSAVPTGGTTSAPANPGNALTSGGRAPGGPSSGEPDAGAPPLKNDDPPPGITKAGQ